MQVLVPATGVLELGVLEFGVLVTAATGICTNWCIAAAAVAAGTGVYQQVCLPTGGRSTSLLLTELVRIRKFTKMRNDNN